MKRILTAVFAVMLTASALHGAEKIAVISMDKVFQDYYKTKIVQANLKRQADIYKDYASKLAESLTKLRDEFTALRDASQNIALSAAASENKRLAAMDKYKQLVAKEQELKDYSREKQAQLRDENDRERAAILNEIRKVVNNQALLGGYTIVFDKSGVSLNNIPVVIYNQASADITAAVIKELNRGHEVKSAGEAITAPPAQDKTPAADNTQKEKK